MKAEYENPLILICEKKISGWAARGVGGWGVGGQRCGAGGGGLGGGGARVRRGGWGVGGEGARVRRGGWGGWGVGGQGCGAAGGWLRQGRGWQPGARRGGQQERQRAGAAPLRGRRPRLYYPLSTPQPSPHPPIPQPSPLTPPPQPRVHPAAAGEGRPGAAPAGDHRGGRGERGAGHPHRQQAARRRQGGRAPRAAGAGTCREPPGETVVAAGAGASRAPTPSLAQPPSRIPTLIPPPPAPPKRSWPSRRRALARTARPTCRTSRC
jgi:hypothetical protein